MNAALNTFKNVTGYNIKEFFESFVLFCNSYYPIIVSYYTGQNVNVEDSFGRLDSLMKQTREIEPLFELKANGFNTIDAWGILDYFTECQTKLWTINNSSRWLRSAIIGRYGSNVVVDRVLKTRETFESVVQELGSNAPQDDWFDVAKNNYVEEEDYSANNGGGMFKINIRNEGNFDIPNIVDNLSTKNILGKDIDVNFRFENNDLATVEYEAAIAQAYNTIISSLKGCIPEFPEYGLPNDMIGGSANALQYPTIFRDLLNMFSRDARWVEVNLIDLFREEDNLFIKINAKTVTNNFLVTNIQL
jgi:hypothetical protein|nr:MAG TPA: secretion system protein [Caudoviricetes sp.]